MKKNYIIILFVFVLGCNGSGETYNDLELSESQGESIIYDGGSDESQNGIVGLWSNSNCCTLCGGIFLDECIAIVNESYEFTEEKTFYYEYRYYEDSSCPSDYSGELETIIDEGTYTILEDVETIPGDVVTKIALYYPCFGGLCKEVTQEYIYVIQDDVLYFGQEAMSGYTFQYNRSYNRIY